jgi:hypothetical protein
MTKDNNLNTDSQEQSEVLAVEDAVDVNSPISLEKAQAVLEADEGGIEASITKQKIEKDKEIAPDLKELKKEQAKKKQEITETKEEIAEEATTEGEPSKFAGKSEVERLKIYKDTEVYNTKLSQKNKELEAKVKELEVVNAKIEEYERNAVISEQRAINTNLLPPDPNSDIYYNDPIAYSNACRAYDEAKENAKFAPIYGQLYSYQKKDVINDLKDRTKDQFVTYAEVEAEVEARLKQNPALFDQHKLKAREVMYNEIKAEMLPNKIEEIKKKAVEEALKQVREEDSDMSNAQVMSSDLTTQRKESKPVDFAEQLENGVDPEKIQKAIKKKYNIKNEF